MLSNLLFLIQNIIKKLNQTIAHIYLYLEKKS